MPVPRHLTPLLAAALLAFTPAAASAQSAGDEQYSDPLAQAETTPAPSTNAPSLSDTPQGTGSSGSGSSGSGSGSGSSSDSSPDLSAPPPLPTIDPGTTSGSSASELPRTGADTGELAIGGVLLVLLGIGLRLRTADVRP